MVIFIVLPEVVKVIKIDDQCEQKVSTKTRKRKKVQLLNGYNKSIQCSLPVFDVEENSINERLVGASLQYCIKTNISDSSFNIQTIYQEGSFMSSGLMHFGPADTKPNRSSGRHCLVRVYSLNHRSSM